MYLFYLKQQSAFQQTYRASVTSRGMIGSKTVAKKEAKVISDAADKANKTIAKAIDKAAKKLEKSKKN